MAKNKKRKGASIKVPAISPKKYIQTKARQLPIYACYVNEDWEASKLAQVLVARRHINGNITFAGYLADLLGMGVKDAMYNYNQPLFEFEEIIENMGEVMVACDYNLAHNLVYGAVEFALEHDVSSHKDWNIAQYILEEDTDDIPLMDLEFGIDGMPAFFEGDEEEWEEDEEFDEDEIRMKEVQMAIFKTIDLAYKKTFPKAENEFNQQIKNAHEQLIINEEPIQDLSEELLDVLESMHYELSELSELEDKREISKFQKKVQDKIKEYPNEPIFYNYMANSYFIAGDHKRAMKQFEQCAIDFPDYLLGKLFYAFQLIQNREYEKAWKILGSKYQLQELIPNKLVFHRQVVYVFYAVTALYILLYEDDLEKALPYYDLILCDEDDTMRWPSVNYAVKLISQAKVDTLEEKHGKTFADIVSELNLLSL